MLSFSFINNSDVEPPLSLIKKFSINLLPCFNECLKATAVSVLVARFFEEEEAADGVEELTWMGDRGGSPWSRLPTPLSPLHPHCPVLCRFPLLTPLPRTGGAGHHGCDGREDGQGDCEDQHEAQRRQPDLGARGRGVRGQPDSEPNMRPQPLHPSLGPGSGTLEPGPACP